MLSRPCGAVTPGTNVCSWVSDVADPSDFENTLITITPAVMRAIPIRAGRSSTCLAQTQATAVIRTIPNPDQIAYTIPVGIVRSGKERSQNAATKQKTDMMLGTGFDGASWAIHVTGVATRLPRLLKAAPC